MVSKFVASLLLCVAWVALAAAAGGAPGAPAVQPRLLWFNKGNNDRTQQPIIIWQQPQQDSDRHHHHRPSWADYYYDYPPPPPPPRRPYGQSENPGLSVIVINPNNVQNFTTPSSGTSSTTSSGSTGRNGNARIVDLLQNLQNSQGAILAQDEPEVINAVEAETDAAAAAAAAGIGAGTGAGAGTGTGLGPGLGAVPAIATLLPQAVANYGEEDARDDDFGDEELALLERQAARGLSPKHLLSFLLQDKRRRRFQEAVAGIYLRNYNLNRK